MSGSAQDGRYNKREGTDRRTTPSGARFRAKVTRKVSDGFIANLDKDAISPRTIERIKHDQRGRSSNEPKRRPADEAQR